MDRVKEDVFNIIGPAIRGAVVLDLFAGSGALGIEALSRGAEKCYFVDKDKKSIELTRYNLEETRLIEKSEIHAIDAEAAIRKLADQGIQFDYIFIDPPYSSKVTQTLLQNLQKCNIIQEKASVIVETDKNDPMPDMEGQLVKVKEKIYASTRITIYQGASPNE